MHIWAYEHPSKADGEKNLVTQGYGPLQAVANILRHEYKGQPEVSGAGYLGFDAKTGKVESVEWPEGRFRVTGKKAEREMGVDYISFQKSVVDTVKAFEVLL